MVPAQRSPHLTTNRQKFPVADAGPSLTNPTAPEALEEKEDSVDVDLLHMRNSEHRGQ